MSELKTVTLKGEARTLINSLRHAFTGHDSLLRELLQNARRAGSDRVEINQDAQAKILEVVDYGCGISDFENLVYIGTSGWDADTLARDKPYGIGMLAAMHACERIEIRTKGQSLCADTAKILNFEPVEITSCEETCTRVKLIGVRTFDRHRVASMVEGFPIPVFLNGEELPRPMAIGAGFVESTIGQIRFPSEGVSEYTRCYQQGFMIGETRSSGWRDRAVVVHLDSKKFIARVPDRDVLIDEADQLKVVEAEVQRQWRIHLMAEKAAGNTALLLQAVKTLRRIGCADLLNDVPLLPASILRWVGPNDLVNTHLHGEPDSREHPYVDGMSLEQATSARLILSNDFEAALEDFYSSSLNSAFEEGFWEGYNRIVYLAAHDAVRVKAKYLDDGHWVHSLPSLIREVSVESTEMIGTQDQVVLTGHRVWDVRVTACKAVALIGSLGRLEVDSLPVVVEVEGRLELAAGEGVNGSILCQIWDDYRDSTDHYQEHEYDDDALEVQRQLDVARGASLAVLIDTALRHLRGVPKLFGGKRFEIAFNEGGNPTVTELQALAA